MTIPAICRRSKSGLANRPPLHRDSGLSSGFAGGWRRSGQGTPNLRWSGMAGFQGPMPETAMAVAIDRFFPMPPKTGATASSGVSFKTMDRPVASAKQVGELIGLGALAAITSHGCALIWYPWECDELCEPRPAHAGFRYAHAVKRSSNMMANWLREANRCRTLLPPFSKCRIARQISLVAASPVGNKPRVLIDFRMTRFRLSMAFVV